MSHISRKQMEKTIAEGGSVLHNGKLITNAGDLPAAEELDFANQLEKMRLAA